MNYGLVALLLFISLTESPAQKINHTSAFRDIESNHYFRFNYDNDYFSSSDENYTQGYNMEFVFSALSKNPVNYLLLKPSAGFKKYGLSIEHIGYTPNKIGRSEIQYGDRPYASAIMLKSFLIHTDTIKNSRLSSSLSIGAIGPLAFGKEMQTAIHKAIDGTIPQGWNNQISNNPIVNYNLKLEKQILKVRNLLELQTYLAGNLGTLFTNASIGFTSLIGQFNSSLGGNNLSKKINIYLYSQPLINFVGYDATLQGGVITSSPYTIQNQSIQRITYQYNFGLIIKTRKLYIEYSRAYISREFKNGSGAGWGGIRIGASL